ncbi:MAG: restriction endonuclease [bacterium]
MNKYLKYSIEYANQRSYLDDLFRIYPTIPEGIRDIDPSKWEKVEYNFNIKDNANLIKNLLELDLFPIKDSYIAYLKRDNEAIIRNPNTINRIAGRLYELGLNKIFENCSEPKETNRQIGPMFKNWLNSGALGIIPVEIEEFTSTNNNAILKGSDALMKEFAEAELNYKHSKGLDFVARFNGKYVIGETKFLTDFGGHQNAQFNDAINTLNARNTKAITVAILDGVLYIPTNNKLYKSITNEHKNHNIMSALVLREFLYQL